MPSTTGERDAGSTPDVRLRPATAGDREFLVYLYGTTRETELAPVAWSDEEKRQFVEMQFEAQHAAYHDRYRDGDFLVIEIGGQPIGRLYLGRLPDEIRVIDIALVPEFCGRGIGTRLMTDVLETASRGQLAVRLHVEQWNPAIRLYERLGFRRLETRGIYEFLEWRRPSVS